MSYDNKNFLAFTNRTYTALKWVVLFLLPALSVLAIALTKIWGLPFGGDIVVTLAAAAAFLGTLLGISTSQYNKDSSPSDVVESLPHIASLMTKRQYNILKWFVILILPAAGVLYLTLGKLWVWTNTAEIALTIAAVNLFLASILGIVGSVMENTPNFLELSDSTYDTLKWLVLQLLPGSAVIYVALAGVWKLPYTVEIVSTVTAVTAFLGIVLGISTARFVKQD